MSFVIKVCNITHSATTESGFKSFASLWNLWWKKVTLGQIFVRVLQVVPPSVIPSIQCIHSLTYWFIHSFIHSSSALYNLYTTRFKTRPCIEILSLVLSVTSNITKDNLAEHTIVWFCVTISGLLRRFRFHDLR
jgi:hypothetical protein